ncbi:RNA-guided endonuclease InsQ/TnpB family protein [Actinocorallia populi]|uniref:RNA-guided endonuclease InsQ/TnpB family protein n=1 Tax=Actinocorallia populi TaxID=2079200 RepID=UPI000D095314|nr:RNA-guided endonuclease TnpB family protein [Actinocorallia populi]
MTAFTYTLKPTAGQETLLRTAGGAARAAYNTLLALVKTRLAERETNPDVRPPWTKFDLINAVNAWRRDLDAQGAVWHRTIPSIVFEEAAADLAYGLASFVDCRKGRRSGPSVGFPVFKKKSRTPYRFRIRAQKGSVAVGAPGRPRAVRLPRLGVIGVREDTRPLRRLLRPGLDGTPRARITAATVRWRRGRWTVAVSVEAPDLHPSLQCSPPEVEAPGWVGVDRGLVALTVAATDEGVETARIPAERIYRRREEGLALRHRRLARTLPGSRRRVRALRQVREYQARTAAMREHKLHEVANLLVNNHDRLVLEHLHVAGMLTNRRLAKSLSDAAFASLARLVVYKAAWRGVLVVEAERWFASSKTCSGCDHRVSELPLSQREFCCPACGLRIDRDLNAAINLAKQGARLCRLHRFLSCPGGGHHPDSGPASSRPGDQRATRTRRRRPNSGEAAVCGSSTARTSPIALPGA